MFSLIVDFALCFFLLSSVKMTRVKTQTKTPERNPRKKYEIDIFRLEIMTTFSFLGQRKKERKPKNSQVTLLLFVDPDLQLSIDIFNA